VFANTGPRGIAGARNAGVDAANGHIVVFLDDDARAEPGWLEALVAPFAGPDVFATGGFIRSAWDVGRPRWFPEEFDWVVGCTYRGTPERQAAVRNPMGANMAFRRSSILAAGGFHVDIGRLGAFPVGGEETELCIRIRRADPGGRVIFAPSAQIRHRVPAARSSWRYFRSRCYHEGRSKAYISSLAGADAALATERRYVSRTLPAGMLRGLGQAARGHGSGALRALAIVAGTAITTAGYVAGRVGIDTIRSSGSSPIRQSEDRPT
jgi:GT2 family glycosyltransferase